MTEQEWLACEDPEPMLIHLPTFSGQHKLLCFTYACVRTLHDLFHYREMQEVIEAAAQVLDGTGALPGLIEASRNVEAVHKGYPPGWCDVEWASALVRAANGVMEPVQQALSSTFRLGFYDPPRSQLAGLIREILGNPFRTASLNPSVLTPTVQSLAQGAYERRTPPSGELDPARLAILSDALEEAGCTDTELLDHLRGPGPHVRGCWALDLVFETVTIACHAGLRGSSSCACRSASRTGSPWPSNSGTASRM